MSIFLLNIHGVHCKMKISSPFSAISESCNEPVEYVGKGLTHISLSNAIKLGLENYSPIFTLTPSDWLVNSGAYID